MKNNLVLCFKVLSLTKKVCQKLLKLPSKKKKKYISLQKIISSTDDRFDSTRLEKRTSYSWNPYETTQHLGLRSNAMIRKKNDCFLPSCHWMRNFYQDTTIGRMSIFKKSIHTSIFRGREKNPLTPLGMGNALHFARARVAYQEDGTAHAGNDGKDALSSISQSQHWDYPNSKYLLQQLFSSSPSAGSPMKQHEKQWPRSSQLMKETDNQLSYSTGPSTIYLESP